jgi:hypothetical protein
LNPTIVNNKKMLKKKLPLGLTFARSQYPLIIGNVQEVGKYFPISSSKRFKRRAYLAIKTNLSFADLCDATDFLDKNLQPQFKDLLWGNALPKNYDELGLSELPFYNKDTQSEINWTLVGIRKFAYEINLFLFYKSEYERELLTGNYSNAEKYLDKIENEICFSLWTLENRFLLKEFSNSGIDNKESLNHFNQNNKSLGITKFLAHFLSLRSERSLSINRYIADLEFNINRLESELKEDYLDYYRFKLSFLDTSDYSKYNAIILFDFNHSIIDRYITLTKIFTNFLTASNPFLEEDKEAHSIKEYVINRTNYLIRKINDPVLFKLKLLASEKLFPAFDAEESRREINIIDKYTSGLYDEVQEDLTKLLLEKPNQFDLYVLYAKSLIYQKKQFISIGNTKSILNIILSNIFNIISAKISPKVLGLNLLSIANNISSTSLSYGIIDFVFFQTEGKKERELLSRLSYNYANPIISEVYSTKSAKLNYLKLLRNKFPDSITIQFFESKLSDIEGLLLFKERIPNAMFQTEYAKKLQEKGDYIGSSKIWETLIEQYNDTVPIWEVAIKNLYNCYENLNQFDDCINLYVNSFLKNNFIVEKIETKSLLKKITTNAYRNVKKTIELPIFFTINGAFEADTHIAFEQFNLNLGIEKASSLFSRFKEFEKKKIVYFLKYTCSPETLRNSPFIISSKERLEERLAISQFLRGIDTDDKQFYDDEIKDIQNILIIQKGLIELDESKIYVNEQGIINNELKDYEAIFQRFKTIAKIVENSKMWMLDLKGNITTINYNESDVKTRELEYSSNPVFDIYQELFEAIKAKFLYSKFGIVTYLSTRIRHGVLIGEIRPVFEKYHLITLNEGSNAVYKKNFYWDMVYQNCSELTKETMQTYLKEFSSSIDGLIFDLIKKHLQVYHYENNADGWFNYDFNDDVLASHSLQALYVKDFNEFSQQVFEILWNKTDEDLNLIQEKIQTNIAMQINELLENLEINIVKLLGRDLSEPLVKAIKDCSTEAQTVIKKISSWFKRSGTVASDVDLSSLIDLVMEYANKSNSHKKIQLERDLQFDCKIRGEFLTHFADLLRIFIENILKHSGKKAKIINAKITTEKLDSYYAVISIENEITDKESLKDIWDEDDMNFSKLNDEGKSGYIKAYKILTSDLRCDKRKSIYIKINEDETRFKVSIVINFKNLVA